MVKLGPAEDSPSSTSRQWRMPPRPGRRWTGRSWMESRFVWTSPSQRDPTPPPLANTWVNPAGDVDEEDTEEAEVEEDTETTIETVVMEIDTEMIVAMTTDTTADTEMTETDTMTDLLLLVVAPAMTEATMTEQDTMTEDTTPMDLLHHPHTARDQEGNDL